MSSKVRKGGLTSININRHCYVILSVEVEKGVNNNINQEKRSQFTNNIKGIYLMKTNKVGPV